jgi:tetratricopeptide (TPR) repeat protein
MPAPLDAAAPTDAAAHAAAEALITSAQDHYRRGAYSEARRDAEAALLLQPDDHGTLRLVGRVRLMSGDISGAIDALRLAIAQSPHDAELRVWLGDAQRSGGNPEAARQSYERALVIDPGNPRAQEGLRLARLAPVRAAPPAVAPGPVREESVASPSPMSRVFSKFNAAGAVVGAVAGLVLAAVTADSSGGDADVLTGLLTVGAGTLAGGSLGAGIAAPRGASWKPWLALGSGAAIAGIGLLAGDRALARADFGDETARDIALDADILLATGLVVIGSAVGIAIGRKSKADERDVAGVSVAPVVGHGVAGIHAAGRF